MSGKTDGVTRRSFLKTAGSTMAIASAATQVGNLSAQETGRKTRLAIVGTGSRGTGMWGSPVVRDYADRVQFVGLCDINKKRALVAQRLLGRGVTDQDGHLSDAGGQTVDATEIPVFTDFDEMIRVTNPERVIVTTMDSTHAQYVIRAMELGCDVICEKPFATDEEQCQAIIDAQKKYGRQVTVTFNARYGASTTKVKELLNAGEIGDLYSVDYAEYLDDDHGTSYFRRWHGIKENSGTLLVHKASHHFDQLNWWIGSDPTDISALGELRRFGRKGPFRHANCRLCTQKAECPSYWDITKSKNLVQMYVECESEDGYYRDGCVYRTGVNIYDAMSVQVKYANKVLVTYSLNVGAPCEGQFIVFNGSKGRIELRNYDRQPFEAPAVAEIRLMKNGHKDSQLIPIERRSGSHGGSDRLIRDHVFIPNSPDPMKHKAGSRAGIMSSIIGIAAYRSIERKVPVQVKDLIDISGFEA
ncbi:MAG: Gfo/Idh/MocA family oxidoreductase [Acidobacteriota bacterium]|nr:MAG: Gfo/Idh/MocA family oxidoreductase [Acidobacteriota bacterium]